MTAKRNDSHFSGLITMSDNEARKREV
jgi:hypothetical protein